MRVLLDTHVALWVAVDHPNVGPVTRQTIDGATEVLVSAASLWELEIKRHLGKIQLPDDLDVELRSLGMKELPVTGAHVVRLRDVRLPSDPFDRLLVAQASAEEAPFLTADRTILAANLDGVRDART